MKFTIITVSYNSGRGLYQTIMSCLSQVYGDYEIIIKDGLSKDGSIEFLSSICDNRIKLISSKDSGIYNAMNQAIPYATGEYVIFMNCGDTFYSNNVLKEASTFILQKGKNGDIFYGDSFVRNRNGIVRLPEQWDAYYCYRYTICHQSMFYRREILEKNNFDETIRICACIVHYINAYAKDGARLVHMPIVISNYEGGGVSDTPKGRKESLHAQNVALKHNFGKRHYIYKLRMLLSGQLIKQFICTVPLLQKVYEKIAIMAYSRRT